MNNAWGNFVFDLIGSFDGGFVYSPVLFTKNADNTVSIVPTDPEEPRYLGTADTAEGDPIENKFDPCTKELTYLLNQGVFTGDFTVGVVLNPN
jgi:hypothetical protein